MRERVLITGASGFVGYHLIEEALKQNMEVYAAVRKSSQTDHLKHLDIKYTYTDFNTTSLKKDIEDNQYDYIIHAAGITKAITQSDYDKINAGYTYNLGEAAASCNVKKMVFISSLAAIGPITTPTGIITEGTMPHPVTSYGKSKLLAEQKLKTVKNLNLTILRPTAVYGPRDKDIFIIIKQFAKGIEPYIGTIQQKLSFIYVKDLAAATFRALNTDAGKIYNLSDGNFYDRYEMASLTKSILNLSTIKFHLPVNFVKLIAIIAEKAGSLRGKASALNLEKLNELMALNWSCSIEKAKHDMGFYPHYDLEAGMVETLQWYKTNKWL